MWGQPLPASFPAGQAPSCRSPPFPSWRPLGPLLQGLSQLCQLHKAATNTNPLPTPAHTPAHTLHAHLHNFTCTPARSLDMPENTSACSLRTPLQLHMQAHRPLCSPARTLNTPYVHPYTLLHTPLQNPETPSEHTPEQPCQLLPQIPGELVPGLHCHSLGVLDLGLHIQGVRE